MKYVELPSENPNQIARTLAGNYVVSTIYRDEFNKEVDATLSGIGNLLGLTAEVLDRADLETPGDYETMVFSCDTSGEVTDWTEVDFARYDSEDLAREGHHLMVGRWSVR